MSTDAILTLVILMGIALIIAVVNNGAQQKGFLRLSLELPFVKFNYETTHSDPPGLNKKANDSATIVTKSDE